MKIETPDKVISYNCVVENIEKYEFDYTSQLIDAIKQVTNAVKTLTNVINEIVGRENNG